MIDLCNHHLPWSCTFRNFRFCITLMFFLYELQFLQSTLYWYFGFGLLRDNTCIQYFKSLLSGESTKSPFYLCSPSHVFHMWLSHRKPVYHLTVFVFDSWPDVSWYLPLLQKTNILQKSLWNRNIMSWNPKTSLQWDKVWSGDTNHYYTRPNMLSCLKRGHSSNNCPQCTSSPQWGFKQKAYVFLGRRGCFSPACGSCGLLELHRKS